MKTKLTMHISEALSIRDVEITGVAMLSKEEYRDVLASGKMPERYTDRLSKYTEAVPMQILMTISKYKVLLVLSEESEHGIAVCGKKNVSYAGLFPNAKEIIENRIKEMTDFTCSLKDLPDGNIQNIPLEMLGDYAKIMVTADNGMGELLLKELKEREEISDIILHEDSFEINYALDYGKKTFDTPSEGLTIAGLIGSNLEDFHLLHADEEHELATIVELYSDTLSEQGRKDWADVLAAKVERIYNGHYGMQADISGCSAERLRDFSYMLAGHCSASDYDRWVNSNEGYHNQVEPDEDKSIDMGIQ